MELEAWEGKFEEFVGGVGCDAAHDLGHVRRVVAWARAIGEEEGARMGVVIPAAWLHDCVVVKKDSLRRREASRLAAKKAGAFLRRLGYPEVAEIEHAIEAHSFSGGIEPATLEAEVVQDADRLDALGAVGIARCMMLGGAMGSAIYDAQEPFPQTRALDDAANVVDHFYAKLLLLESTMRTGAGRREARRRTRFMREYLAQLDSEIG